MQVLRQFFPRRLPSTIMLCVFLLLAGSLITGCDKNSQATATRRLPQVSYVTVSPSKVALTTNLPGRTESHRIAEIRPQVSGLIKKRLFTEGSEVKAGQVLYQIDSAPFQAALDNAKANHVAALKGTDGAKSALKACLADVARLKVNLELAQKSRKRYEDSYKDRIVSAIQLDEAVTKAKAAEASLRAAEARVQNGKDAVAAAEAAIGQAEAALETARINLGYCKVTAPISGRIGRSKVTEGAVVTAYQALPLATIQQIDPIYVDVPQSTTELLRLKRCGLNQSGVNQRKVSLTLEDGTPYPQTGTLQFSDITVDPSTGSVLLRIVFPNPKGLLLPGMFVTATVMEGIDEHAFLVPQQGVMRGQRGEPYALTVDEKGKVKMSMLKLNRAIKNKWLVDSGLKTGDRLIVEGLKMLRPGAMVKATPWKKADDKKTDPAKPAAGHAG
ncbi:efflux RND transporter periplasmic adaptor subunit [Dethiosulfatarculus sandiegensis]|uniref:RND transporter n=1 Tax=Dethiosulfatarculus sandiegensis TaxID=1429043 RepID=A0A0D2HM87_9BACT|nr:efflux RND transporter periplasmic adaptor subunit [Dethiosulfatarculus sandiegensis]KIX11728.1 RND transporter [Dethiosulfatarculus sandiegensis]